MNSCPLGFDQERGQRAQLTNCRRRGCISTMTRNARDPLTSRPALQTTGKQQSRETVLCVWCVFEMTGLEPLPSIAVGHFTHPV